MGGFPQELTACPELTLLTDFARCYAVTTYDRPGGAAAAPAPASGGDYYSRDRGRVSSVTHAYIRVTTSCAEPVLATRSCCGCFESARSQARADRQGPRVYGPQALSPPLARRKPSYCPAKPVNATPTSRPLRTTTRPTATVPPMARTATPPPQSRRRA